MQSVNYNKLEWGDEDGEIRARLNGELYTGITTWQVGPQYREQSLVNGMRHGRQWAFEESQNLTLWEEWFEHGVPVGRHYRWVDYRTRKRTADYENGIIQLVFIENKWGNKLQEYDRKAREFREWHLNGTLRSVRKFLDVDHPFTYCSQTFWAADATWLLTIATDAPDQLNVDYLNAHLLELDDSYDTEFVVALYAKSLENTDSALLISFLQALSKHKSTVYKVLTVRMLEKLEDATAQLLLEELRQYPLDVPRQPRNNCFTDGRVPGPTYSSRRRIRIYRRGPASDELNE